MCAYLFPACYEHAQVHVCIVYVQCIALVDAQQRVC